MPRKLVDFAADLISSCKHCPDGLCRQCQLELSDLLHRMLHLLEEKRRVEQKIERLKAAGEWWFL